MKINFRMIKERIVQLIETKRVPKEKFFSDMGVTSANFRGKARSTPVNSDVIANIFAAFPDVNLEWLIAGKGQMFKPETEQIEETISLKTYEAKVEECALLKAELKAVKEQAAKYAEVRGASSGIIIPVDV